ncbi:hypothetical protein PFISCL1PPCAC_22856, partial [Pristionchus fissidentatus]
IQGQGIPHCRLCSSYLLRCRGSLHRRDPSHGLQLRAPHEKRHSPRAPCMQVARQGSVVRCLRHE